jgi:hypothetical protein
MGASLIKTDFIKEKILRPSLTSHFVCDFTPPSNIQDKMKLWGVTNSPVNNNDNLSLLCAEASLPGSSVATVDIENDFHGVSEKHAYRRLYDDRADFTFYVSIREKNEYYAIKFFEAWISLVVNEQYDAGPVPIQNSEYYYRVSYPESYYAKDLSITKFERDFSLGNSSLLTYKFVNAYPISINSMPVTYEQSELLKCTVSFFYSRYYITSTGSQTPTSVKNVNAPGVPELNRSYSSPLPPSVISQYLGDPTGAFLNASQTSNYFDQSSVSKLGTRQTISR